MDQSSAKRLIEETQYLDNQILVYREKAKTVYGKIIWKGYTAAFKDEEGKDGTVRVRIKDLHSSKEFSESLAKIANLFPKEFILNRASSKNEILNVLQNNNEVKAKTLNWIKDSVTLPADQPEEVESLLTELWLESKVTKARFKANDDVTYSPRG